MAYGWLTFFVIRSWEEILDCMVGASFPSWGKGAGLSWIIPTLFGLGSQLCLPAEFCLACFGVREPGRNQ